jgi:serine/threonine-protein kinase
MKPGEERIGAVVRSATHAYKLERLIGFSSTSAVYDAVREDGSRFAAKILHATLCREERVLQRFQREAFVASRIAHPAIAGVYDDGHTDGAAFVVLDLLRGETLEERRVRAGGRLPVADVVPLALDVLDVLAAVHAAGIIHRDVKPQNLFLTEDAGLKLLDFGTARILEADGGEPISVEGLVIGTPSFMSPEQASGENATADGRSDIWSLGATLFFVTSGEYVHPSREAHQRLISAATKPARSLAAAVPGLDLDARFVAAVDRALAFEREARWPDVASMRAALSALDQHAKQDARDPR